MGWLAVGSLKFFFFGEKAPFFLLDQVGNVFKKSKKKGWLYC